MADQVAQYESESHPGKFYHIFRAGDGSHYCDCPAWRFQKGKLPEERTCKHLRLYYAQAKRPAAPAAVQRAAFVPAAKPRKPALEKRR